MAENIPIDHLRRRQRGAERFTPQRTDGEAPLREPLTPDIAERLAHRQALDAVALNVSNLLNKDYNAICYHTECYPGNLRSATVTARYRF